MARRSQTKRKYGSAAARTRQAAAVAGPGGGGGTMFKNLPEGVDWYNPEEGTVTLRLIPYVVTDKNHPDGAAAPVDDIWYKRPFKRFRQIGTDKKPYISPKSIGKPCPIIEYYQDAKADPSIPDKEADKAKPQDCVMYNVQTVERDGSTSDMMFWWFSYHCFEKQLKKELLDPYNEDFAAFLDLEGGFDIRVRWDKEMVSFGKGNSFDFLKAGSINFIERDDIDESILEEVADLDNVLVVEDYQSLKNIFLEIDDEGQEESDPPRRGKSAEKEEPPARRRRGKSAEKEEKEKTPRRGRKSKEPDPEPDPEPEELQCPHNYKFGEDFDTERRCKRCKINQECGDEYDKNSPDDSGKDSNKDSSDNKSPICQHGHVFGTDCDSQKDCEKCKAWDACIDEMERLQNQ